MAAAGAGGIIAVVLVVVVVVAIIYGSREFQRSSQRQRLQEARARLNVRGSEPRFETFGFPNSPAGQQTKNAALTEATNLGWSVVSESITPGRFNSNQAFCLGSICLPLAFLAGRTDDTITVTLSHIPQA